MVLTVHDLLWHEKKGLAVTTLPKWQYWIKYLGYRVITSLALAKARRIIVPAQTIKQIVVDHYPQTATRIVPIKEGALATTHLSETPSIKDKHLLYIGSLYPHKNLSVVLNALSYLPDWRLTCVGARSAFHGRVQSQICQLGLDQRVELKGYVPDEKIALLYQQVTALIQPSTSEGFGLTGVEAMASGLPVIASDIPIFKEIYQDGALFFDPNNPKSLVDLLENLTTTQIRQVSKLGKKVAAEYSWQSMAEQTLALYQESL